MGKFFANTPKDMVRVPIQKGPRARNIVKSILNVTLYNEFKSKYPNANISRETFKKIIIRGNEILRDAILENREGVILPKGFGRLFIGAYDKNPKKPYYDWSILMNKGFAYSHKNYESDRYFCKLFYSAFGEDVRYPFKGFWYFKTAHEMSLRVSKAFRADYNKFIKVPKFKRLKQIESSLYKTIKIIHHEPNRGRVDFTDTQPY